MHVSSVKGTHWIRAAIPCGYPSGVMTTVNVYVIYVIARSFWSALLPDSPFGQTVAQENCAFLIKFGEVDIMQAELTRYFLDTLNRVDVRTIKRQKVESIRTYK